MNWTNKKLNNYLKHEFITDPSNIYHIFYILFSIGEGQSLAPTINESGESQVDVLATFLQEYIKPNPTLIRHSKVCPFKPVHENIRVITDAVDDELYQIKVTHVFRKKYIAGKGPTIARKKSLKGEASPRDCNAVGGL